MGGRGGKSGVRGGGSADGVIMSVRLPKVVDCIAVRDYKSFKSPFVT